MKNNLAVVMGLLNLQAGRIADPAARGMLGESHRRIHSMALVHETLYQSRDVSRIPAAEYVNTIAGHLAGAFGVGPDRVRVEMAVDDLALGLDAAVPFGLILNELVSNAFKHAFPADRRGTIRVAVRRDGPDHWTFEVGDDGVGLAKAFDPAQSRSLGLQLVDVLARQMNATLDVRNGVGTAFHLRIPFSPAERS